MIPLINANEYAIVTGSNTYNAQQGLKFNADVVKAQTLKVKPILPLSMWVVLQDGGPYGPELTAFLDDYIKPMIAYAMLANTAKSSSVQVTPAGMRTLTDTVSQQANNELLSGTVVMTEGDYERYRTAMYNEYKTRAYIFDGVAFPPEPSMKLIWNQSWAGYTYTFYNNRWGWWNGDNYLAPWGQNPTLTNNGVNVGFIKAKTYWGTL